MTGPPPYSPSGITPSNVAYSRGWSSVGMARRFSRGSVDGPLGTAHDFSTPPAASRKSQCMAVASCCWMTNRGRRPVARRRLPPAGSGVLRLSRFRRYSWSGSVVGVTLVPVVVVVVDLALGPQLQAALVGRAGLQDGLVQGCHQLGGQEHGEVGAPRDGLVALGRLVGEGEADARAVGDLHRLDSEGRRVRDLVLRAYLPDDGLRRLGDLQHVTTPFRLDPSRLGPGWLPRSDQVSVPQPAHGRTRGHQAGTARL